MGLTSTYATKEDYANFTMQDIGDAPENIDVLLKRASEKVTALSYRGYSSNNQYHVQAAMMAVCAQVQYWVENNDGNYIEDSDVQSFSFGNISVTNNSNVKSKSQLCSMSMLYLRRAGLLYKGVKS